MPVEILMPALSPTMEEGTLAKWLVKEGDTVESGDLLAEIETDKATMEFEAVDDGVIGKILIEEGTEGVKVNTPICVLLEDGEDASAADSSSAPKADAPKSEAPKEEKADAPAPAPTPKAAPKKDGNRIFASPLARRIAEQKGLDLSTLSGSGPHGRIVKADVENAQATDTPAAAKSDAPAAPALATSADSETVKKMYTERDYEEISLNGMRKTIAARLTEAKQTIPHFYLRRSITLDALLKTRSEINAGLADSGVKISVNDFIIKASAKALQDVPGCNAVWAGDRLLQMKASDVAVAVAIDGGLFTPVIQDAEIKPLSVISTEMKDLAARAKERKLAPHEYQGGSFAISNLGMMGIENFDAVINPPHGSILAVGAGQKQPIVNSDGALATATKMSVTLSVDHRVIDGALGAEFLAALSGYIEKPMSMLV
ncbi:pyruvate dehydrogenase complex dihydrolipoamide acetyltransferase [Amylibacter sp. IMCC11727]|uniref:pyruvate dehydrogenase complex dihydrolipoamide acetyltransferase n=1 Tax=Amylibacter sp. IMCC11727 TaxID=3039851 RepID=UPI00244DA7F8|nr:pyruvate dehydrogenase complex dihydrolipoamide acetyltransferase [Amylibacter sp. IMCC11727]WGI20570.1 pyruvate dehydrogenase complex dihydrolipoamide acetyltransferase [Amylibacter sp. IMCC11727]